MNRNKSFDCVEMKNAIQAQLSEEYEGLTPEQVRKRRQERLASSDSPVARKWRRLARAGQRKEDPAASAGRKT